MQALLFTASVFIELVDLNHFFAGDRDDEELTFLRASVCVVREGRRDHHRKPATDPK
jgi:hypothetical protein